MAIVTDPRGGAGATGEVHATKQNDLGIVRTFSDGNEYIYLQGIGSTVVGSWVVFDPGTYTTALLATTSKGQCAVATAATIASTFGWYGYVGSFAAFNLSATLSNLALFASGTAGAATTAITKNAQIKGAVSRGAPPTTTGGATQTTVMDRPFIGSYDESA